MQTFTGREYLKIDIASNFGLEKKSWAERLTWFDQNEGQLLKLLPQAEEPALYYAGVKAYEDVKAGKPTGYMISLDATSSGLQLLAALTGDHSAAQLCNVVDTGTRQDAYTAIYNEMLKVIGDKAKITRDDCKDAIMTSLYGSKAVPKRVFGEGALLDTFYFTMREVAPAAWELNEAFLAMWNPEALSHDWVLPDNFHVHIKVMEFVKERVHFLNQPFDVFYYENRPIEEGRSLGANTIHSVDGMIVREMTRRCDYDPRQIHKVRKALEKPINGVSEDILTQEEAIQLHELSTLWGHFTASGYLSARIIDYITPITAAFMDPKERAIVLEMLDTFPKRPFKVVSIHDCFRCHPNYGNDLREQYNLQLALIAKSNLLGYLITQIVGRPVNIGKLYPNLYKDVLKTNYALS
jgi:hypothetical protein